MGSDRPSRCGRGACIAAAAAVLTLLALVGCTSDPKPERSTVTPTNAYTAVVRWEIERGDAVVDADGSTEAPVIFLAAGSGGTVDVGVQAGVVSEIDDAAVIRFVDDARDARDETLDNEPVKDDGVMILIDEFEPDQVSVEARIVRYQSTDDDRAWILQLTATGDTVEVASANPATE